MTPSKHDEVVKELSEMYLLVRRAEDILDDITTKLFGTLGITEETYYRNLAKSLNAAIHEDDPNDSDR